MTFVVGDRVSSYFERPYMNRYSYGWHIVLLVSSIPSILIVLPQFVLHYELCRYSFYFSSIWSVRMRLSQTSKFFKVSLMLSIVICFLFPICFFDSNGPLCFMHAFGNFYGIQYRYHYIGSKYCLTYLFGVFYPIVNFIHGREFHQYDIIFIIDILFLIYGIYRWIYDVHWLYRKLHSITVLLYSTSPVLTIIPVLLYGQILLSKITGR